MTLPIPQRLTEVLESDEKLLWWGFPVQGLVLRPYDAYFIPTSLVWMWGASAPNFLIGFDPMTLAVSAPFVVIGLYMLVGRFLFDSYRRARTVYSLTSRRILILGPLQSTSIDLDNIEELQVLQASSGRGSIQFGPDMFGLRENFLSGVPRVPTFERIENADVIYGGICRARYADVMA